jgi:hypothetical protein
MDRLIKILVLFACCMVILANYHDAKENAIEIYKTIQGV